MSQNPYLSVIVPVYNEEGFLKELTRQITDALEQIHNFEIIFIDDGSTDGSYQVLRSLQKEDSRIRVIKLRKNFGQTAAMSAGFDYARGEIIAPCDADGQNDPADIPRLVEKLNEGYDIVSGWRKNRQDRAITRKVPSRIANWLIGKLTGVRLHDYGCSLKVYRKETLQMTRLYGEMHRFIPALANWSGAKIAEMEVNHRPRTTGSAKYGLERTIKVILDLLTVKFLGSYGTKPIYIFGGLGILSGIGSVISGSVVLYMKYISPRHLSMNRNPLLILTAILIIATVQFILMGLIAELVVRTYHESQGRAIYTVREVLEDKSIRETGQNEKD